MERFWAKVDRRGPTECWPWTANVDTRGYGRFQLNGRSRRAHRVSYELSAGPIPEGMHVCHRCDNPLCVNPGHLFLGRDEDNVADKVAKNRQARGSSIGAKLSGDLGGAAKLTWADVRSIRAAAVSTLQAALATRFGVSKSAISLIVSGRTWKEAPRV